MLQLSRDQLTITHHEIHPSASLTLQLRSPSSPQPLPLRSLEESTFTCPSIVGITLYFLPHPLTSDPKGPRFPFALLVALNGASVINGDPAPDRLAIPQNYLTTPPQGALDAAFINGQLVPLHSHASPHSSPNRLDITIFPMKKIAIDDFLHRNDLSGYQPHTLSRHFTLPNTGHPRCEPLYEDVCTPGDWDQSRAHHLIILLESPSILR